MKTHWRSSIPLAMAITLAANSAVAQELIGGRYIWDGSDNGLWINAANWTIGRSPTAGSDLSFPPAGFWRTTVNTFSAGTSFGRLTYSDAGYEVSGLALTLTEGIAATHGAGVTKFGPDITLGADAAFTAQNADATLTLGGVVTLAGSFTPTFSGAGLVQVSNAVRRAPGFFGIALIQDGTGTTLLTKSNTLGGGQVRVQAGTMALAHSFALGGAGTTKAERLTRRMSPASTSSPPALVGRCIWDGSDHGLWANGANWAAVFFADGRVSFCLGCQLVAC